MQVDDLIQVAGVIDQAEVNLLVECEVPFLGFPLRLPIHREDLTEEAAAGIIKTLPESCHAVLITYLNQATEIVEFCSFLGVRIVQLHGDIDIAQLQTIKSINPGLSIIKSLVIGRVSNEEVLRTMHASCPFVDAFITDTFDPETGASGATGKTHSWCISREIVSQSERPVILAGGLTPENVKDAILTVRPAGVDAHTGLEDPSGRKDRQKVQQFVAQAREALRLISQKSLPARPLPF